MLLGFLVWSTKRNLVCHHFSEYTEIFLCLAIVIKTLYLIFMHINSTCVRIIMFDMILFN